MVLGWLVSFGSAASAAPPVARADSLDGSGCAPLKQVASEQPRVAADVRTTLAVHGAVVRWDPVAGPIRVWVQPRAVSTVNWDQPSAEWRAAVLSAARAWRGIVPGLDFRSVRDSADADVVVSWADPHSLSGNASPGLAAGTAGRTVLFDTRGRARGAHVRLALAAPTGALYGIGDVRAVARHEFGHVLGLAHHAAATSVMAARMRVDRLQAGDRDALRLLYTLPVGERCQASRPAPAARAADRETARSPAAETSARVRAG